MGRIGGLGTQFVASFCVCVSGTFIGNTNIKSSNEQGPPAADQAHLLLLFYHEVYSYVGKGWAPEAGPKHAQNVGFLYHVCLSVLSPIPGV